MIAEEVLLRHQQAFPDRPVNGHVLEAGGQYQWRKDGEFHLFNPQTIHKLQAGLPHGNYKIFKEYSTLVNEHEATCTLRGLLDFKNSAGRFPSRKSNRSRPS